MKQEVVYVSEKTVQPSVKVEAIKLVTRRRAGIHQCCGGVTYRKKPEPA